MGTASAAGDDLDHRCPEVDVGRDGGEGEQDSRRRTPDRRRRDAVRRPCTGRPGRRPERRSAGRAASRSFRSTSRGPRHGGRRAFRRCGCRRSSAWRSGANASALFRMKMPLSLPLSKREKSALTPAVTPSVTLRSIEVSVSRPSTDSFERRGSSVVRPPGRGPEITCSTTGPCDVNCTVRLYVTPGQSSVEAASAAGGCSPRAARHAAAASRRIVVRRPIGWRGRYPGVRPTRRALTGSERSLRQASTSRV